MSLSRKSSGGNELWLSLLHSTEKETASTTPYISLTLLPAHTSPPVPIISHCGWAFISLSILFHSWISFSHTFLFLSLMFPSLLFHLPLLWLFSKLALFLSIALDMRETTCSRAGEAFALTIQHVKYTQVFFFFFLYVCVCVCVFWSYTCKMTSTTARND